jgi:hypothetical protein
MARKGRLSKTRRSLGSMSIPWLMGQLLDQYTPQSMIVILLAAVLASIVVLVGIGVAVRLQRTPVRKYLG